MKNTSKVLPIVLFFSLASFICDKQNKKISVSASKSFAVVELFTSEGCSSCPPADEAVAKLLNVHNENVFVLAFHVDYWNYLGWKDNFSSKAYSERQQQYGQQFKLNSIYTPQVVINGTTQFVGSDEKKLNATVDKDLKQQTTNAIDVNAATNGKNVQVDFKTNASPAEKLNFALVQLHAETKVQRGENSGRDLKHVNVVRDFKTLDGRSSGSLDFALPQNLNPEDFIVIAFTQNATSGTITAAAKALIR
jgi:hypothetical protein